VHDIHFLLFFLDVDECTCTASSPLCDVNAQCSNIRGSLMIAADANLIILETEKLAKVCLECRESRFKRCFKSLKEVLLCFANSVCLGIKFFFFVQIVPVT